MILDLSRSASPYATTRKARGWRMGTARHDRKRTWWYMGSGVRQTFVRRRARASQTSDGRQTSQISKPLFGRDSTVCLKIASLLSDGLVTAALSIPLVVPLYTYGLPLGFYFFPTRALFFSSRESKRAHECRGIFPKSTVEETSWRSCNSSVGQRTWVVSCW